MQFVNRQKMHSLKVYIFLKHNLFSAELLKTSYTLDQDPVSSVTEVTYVYTCLYVKKFTYV